MLIFIVCWKLHPLQVFKLMMRNFRCYLKNVQKDALFEAFILRSWFKGHLLLRTRYHFREGWQWVWLSGHLRPREAPRGFLGSELSAGRLSSYHVARWGIQ